MFFWRMKLTGYIRAGVEYSMWVVGDQNIALTRFLSELVARQRLENSGMNSNEHPVRVMCDRR